MINGFDTPTRILLAVGVLLVGVFVAIEPEDVSATPGLARRTLQRQYTDARGDHHRDPGAAECRCEQSAPALGSDLEQAILLSDQTLKVLTDLRPVQFTAFYQSDAKQAAADLLREYEIRSNGKVSVEFITGSDGTVTSKQVLRYGTTVLTMGDRTQTVSGSRETDFTTGLLRLVNPTQKKIFYRPDITSVRWTPPTATATAQMRTSLQSDNYVVDTLVLAGGPPGARRRGGRRDRPAAQPVERRRETGR